MNLLEAELKLHRFIGKEKAELDPTAMVQIIEIIQTIEFFHWQMLKKLCTTTTPIAGFPLDYVCHRHLQAIDGRASSRLQIGLYPFVYTPQASWNHIINEAISLAMSENPINLTTESFHSPLKPFCRSYLRLVSCVAKICPEIAVIFLGIPLEVANRLAEPAFDKLASEILIARIPVSFRLRGKQTDAQNSSIQQINSTYQDFLYRLHQSEFPSFRSDNFIHQERLKCIRASLRLNKASLRKAVITPNQPGATNTLMTIGRTFHLCQASLKQLGLCCGLNEQSAQNLARQITYKLECGVKKEERQLTSEQINEIAPLTLALLTETDLHIDSQTWCRYLPFATVLATTLLFTRFHLNMSICDWGDLMTQVNQQLQKNLVP